MNLQVQAALVFEVPPGSYQCRIVQHVLQAAGWKEGRTPEFTVALEAGALLAPPWETIPWADRP